MNISINNQNQSPAFGHLKLNHEAAARIAFEIQSAKSPQAEGVRFIREIAEPINKLKSTVTCNDTNVFLERFGRKGISEYIVSSKWCKFAPEHCYDKIVTIFTSTSSGGYNVNRSFVSFESSEEADQFIKQVKSFEEIESNLLCAKVLAQSAEGKIGEPDNTIPTKSEAELSSKFFDYHSTMEYLLDLYA